MRTITPVLAGLALLTPASAHAEGPNMSGYVKFSPSEADVVVIVCNASSSTNSYRDVPVATTVICSVDGVEQRAVAPGPFAATTFELVAPPPRITICDRGEAIYHDFTTHVTSQVIGKQDCVEISSR